MNKRPKFIFKCYPGPLIFDFSKQDSNLAWLIWNSRFPAPPKSQFLMGKIVHRKLDTRAEVPAPGAAKKHRPRDARKQGDFRGSTLLILHTSLEVVICTVSIVLLR